jgi:hypothetical protein
MKRLVSFLLGGLLLIGAATLSLPGSSANASDRHDKNHWRDAKNNHRRHHRRHRHYRRNKLSY